MPEYLINVLKDGVKFMNCIKARTLNSQLFPLLCEDMCSNFKTLLLYTKARLFELRFQVLLFLPDRDDMKLLFIDQNWLQRLAYLWLFLIH